MRRTHPWTLLATLALLAGCGGGGSSPVAPGPPPEPGHTVVGLVFYDEDGSGRPDGDEVIRVPDVEITTAGHSGRSEKATGRVVVNGVPAGAQALAVRPETLPPFFQAGAPVAVQVPQAAGATALIPLTLPIAGNRPGVYMAFGDSLTRLEGAPPLEGYPGRLEARLREHFGAGDVPNHGRDGTNSFEAMERISRNLEISRAAYTLLLYGTNDWHAPECNENPRCTADNLRVVVQTIKRYRSLPFIATIPPVNPALTPPGRNEWIDATNEQLRAMAREEGAFLVDLHQAYRRRGDMSSLFIDHVHPSDAGYDLIATAFFEAVAHGRATPP